MLVRKIQIMMFSALAMTVVMVLSITAWTATKNNERAAADSLMMFGSGIEAMAESVSSLNYDYSSWTAAMDNAVARDVDWLYENMGTGANGAEIDLLELHWPTDWTSLSWTTEVYYEELDPLTTPVVPVEVAQQIHSLLIETELGVRDTIDFVLSMDGVIYFVSASKLQPWNEETLIPTGELPMNFMAKRLSQEVLDTFAGGFLIEDMAIVDSPTAAGLVNIPLTGLEGTPIGFIEWGPPRPGDALVQTAAVPITIGLALFLAISGSVTLIAKRNASELVVREKEASSAARTDIMTGLPNRMAFNESLAVVRQQKERVAILFMDLNGFKAINDEFGHDIGDRLLKEIAALSEKFKRPQDTIARLGGDEFNLIFTGEDAEEACLKYCADLADELSHAVHIDKLVFQPRIAMGFTVSDSQSSGISELMRRADYAMYAAKNAKSVEPVKYDRTLEEDELREKDIVSALRRALDAGTELSVAYQPIVSSTDGKMELAEALVRWTSEEIGSISPAVFIPVAERSGLIVELGRRVIEMVFADLQVRTDIKVSINLSAVQLRSRSILKEIDQLAKRFKIDPKRVTFEVTESMLVEDPELTAFVLDKLREQGFDLALDDLGVGFSSIGYLRKFNFDKLKIDKSFVDDIGVEKKQRQPDESTCSSCPCPRHENCG